MTDGSVNGKPSPSSDAQDYKVGRGKPPLQTQFEKGKSGNPSGRKKSKPTVADLVNKVLAEKMTVTENGKSKRLSRLEVMLRKLANDAMKGDQKAVRLLLDLLETHQDRSSSDLNLGLLNIDSQQLIHSFLQQQQIGQPAENDVACNRAEPDGAAEATAEQPNPDGEGGEE